MRPPQFRHGPATTSSIITRSAIPIGSIWERRPGIAWRPARYDYKTKKGENLAAGYREAAAVLAGWKASPTHDAVMLDPEYVVVGVSLVQVFGLSFRLLLDRGFRRLCRPHRPPCGRSGCGGHIAESPLTSSGLFQGEAPA